MLLIFQPFQTIVEAGRIESLRIEDHAVDEAKVGQQVGLKISDFKRAKVGDVIECFETLRVKDEGPWSPGGGVFYR